MRTAGIDYDLRRVVLCSIPLVGEPASGALWGIAETGNTLGEDLSVRARGLFWATRDAFTRTAGDDVVSVCVEHPGGQQQLKMGTVFGSVSAGVPADVQVCSMNASEWKRRLNLAQNKKLAHSKIRERYELPEMDEHHLDAFCIALAWRGVQEDA